MKKHLATLAPYVIALGIDFYLLPLLISNTGTAMLLTLCVMPCAALCCGVIYGVRSGFGVTLSAAALVLFIPAVFIYYNSSAWIYAPVYAAAVLAGTGIGQAFRTKK